MEHWRNRVAVVTGASSGIGAAITKDLLKAGLIVVALARRKDNIEDYRQQLPMAQQQRLYALHADVTCKLSVDKAFDWVNEKLGGIDVLINNAGIYRVGQLRSLTLNDLQETMQVNVMGLLHATQRASQSMKARNVTGHIICINSAVGHVVPNSPMGKQLLNIYPATKHAVTAITEVLRQEFAELGGKIKITSISPGLTNTDIVPEKLRNVAKRILQPEDVSSAVLYALSTPQSVQVREMMIEPN